MKNSILTLILSLLTAIVFVSCKDIEGPADKMGEVKFALSVSDFQNTGRPGARIEATSTWKHIYAENAVLTITNKTNGQKYTLQYDPNDFSEAFSITLPFGSYSFESSVEGDVFESFLPYTLEGEFTLNSQSMDISLQATTDYGLVTVKNQFVTGASISASGVNAESLTLLDDESYHYVYVQEGTTANLQITESYQGTSIERSITVSAYTHYNFILQIGEGNANIIDLIMDAFGYEEEEIIIGAGSLPSYLPKNGLVAWYPFNGNANDESGNGNDGIVNGASLASNRNGLENSAYFFNGESSNIQFNQPFFGGGQISELTLYTRVYFNNLNDSPNIWGKTKFWGEVNFEVLNNGSFQLFWANSISGNRYSVISSDDKVLEEGKWYDLIVVFISGKGQLYLNGLPINTKLFWVTQGGGETSDTQVEKTINFEQDQNSSKLGLRVTSGSPGNYLNGIIDNFAIWDRPLTEDEISRLYEGV